MNITNPTTFGTPALVYSTSNSSGTAGALRANDTIAIFSTDVPEVIAFGQSASAGDDAFASRLNHDHGMANTLVAYGSYTGNGSNDMEVTGIGFTPKAVWVVIRKTVDQAATQEFFCTPSILDDGAGAGLLHGSGGQGHRIDLGKFVSFDADGFSVADHDDDEDPNKNGEVYNYLVVG